MKRLIKYWSSYNDTQFSDCSTKYELFPVVVEDSASENDLMALAEKHGLQTRCVPTVPKQSRRTNITHSLELVETKERLYFDKTEIDKVYLGFIEIPESRSLELNKGINKRLTEEQACEIVNNQDLGVADVGTLDGKPMIVKEGWEYYHEMKLLGYSLESFQKHYGVTATKGDTYFSDSVSQCSECNEYDYNDNGYSSNFRFLDHSYLGINCGCFSDACKNNVEAFADNTETPMELGAAEELAKINRLKFVERFIGGMVDGRGGHWKGESVREGTPESVLAELKIKHPNTEYVFTHDESGQFQTYFSVWRIKKSSAKSA